MPKASKELLETLNEDLSYELGAIIQYMYHHVMASGVESPAVAAIFRTHALAEMLHAETLAERIDLLGGVPTTKVAPVQVGGDLNKMLRDDLDGEYLAIRLYKEHIKLANREDDPVTRRMLEDILAIEEGHANALEAVLEKK